MFLRWILGIFLAVFLSLAPAHAEKLTIVAFGDSLTAGFGLRPEEGFTRKLQKALDQKGYQVTIVNAGVSGDTTSGGRARLDWSIGDDVDGVILELGANDMLRGVPTNVVRDNLEAMVVSLKGRNIPVLIAGMRAAPNLGEAYGEAFGQIFPDIAQKYDTLLYPFFLDGLAGAPALNQPDGIHPTAEGVDVIVKRILPSVEKLIERIRLD